MNFGAQYKPTWEEITTPSLPDELLAPVDRENVKALSKMQTQWRRDGVLYLPALLPMNLVQAYCQVRQELDSPGGWRSPTPYVHVKELRDLCLFKPLMGILEELIGEDMGLHLNLTGWVSTERDFHQDTFLNPWFVGTHYAAAWMALDDIHADSGPFQYVPGSHRWDVIRREMVFKFLTPSEQADPGWPTHTQQWVADACMGEILKRNQDVVTYVPRKGDVLLWHSNLVHRGSPASIKGMPRKALIAHYSAISKRLDMLNWRRHDNGERYYHTLRPLE